MAARVWSKVGGGGHVSDFVLLDESGKLERGQRTYIGEVQGWNEARLRDTLFTSPEIIPIDDIDSTFGPLVPLCKELRTDAGPIDAVFINERGRLTIVEFKLAHCSRETCELGPASRAASIEAVVFMPSLPRTE